MGAVPVEERIVQANGPAAKDHDENGDGGGNPTISGDAATRSHRSSVTAVPREDPAHATHRSTSSRGSFAAVGATERAAILPAVTRECVVY